MRAHQGGVGGLLPRSAVVTAAAANRLQSFDMVFPDFNDPVGLEEESRFARQLGFTGKTCIHPNQTPIVNHAFSPAPEEIERAQRLVQAFADQQAAGAGAFTFDGKMVDMPMLRAAEKILVRRGYALGFVVCRRANPGDSTVACAGPAIR